LIGEINPEWYDVEGRKVFRPDSRRKSGFKPTFPAGRYFSQPLKHGVKTYWTSGVSCPDANMYPTKSNLESEITGSLPTYLKSAKRETARISLSGHGGNSCT
jgi:hypothetical protein